MKIHNNHFLPLPSYNEEVNKIERNIRNGKQDNQQFVSLENVNHSLSKKAPLLYKRANISNRYKRQADTESPPSGSTATENSAGFKSSAPSAGKAKVLSSLANNSSHIREIRAIDDTPSHANLRPDELGRADDKQIPTGAKPPSAGANPVYEKLAGLHYSDLITPASFASGTIQSWAKKKWHIDLDPDKTDVVTLQYQPRDPSNPAAGNNAVIQQKMTLTEAVLNNWRDSSADALRKLFDVSEFTPVPGSLHITDRLEDHYSAATGFRHEFGQEFSGIFRQSSPPAYTSATQINIPANELVNEIKATVPQIYSKIDNYWKSHKEDYRLLSKTSFLKASELQRAENSLTQEGYELVSLAAGLPRDKSAPLADEESIKAKNKPDGRVSVAPLKIYRYTSTDMLVIGDHKSDRKILYIPGNSSPFHEFSASEGKNLTTWLAEQVKDPAKRAVIASHFYKGDRPDGIFRSGVNTALEGLADYPEQHRLPYDRPGFTTEGVWQPDQYISTGTTIAGDIFSNIADSWQTRTQQEASDIPSNGAIAFREGLDYANDAGQYLWPVALAFPAADVAYGGIGLLNLGQGIADTANGNSAEQRAAGLNRAVFGLLNATPAIGTVKSALSKATEDVIAREAVSAIANEGLPRQAVADTASVIPTSLTQHSLPSYAVPNGEQLIQHVTPDSRGIYQINQGQNASRWFIRSTNNGGQSELYEIRSDFMQNSNYVNIIDPQTRKAVMLAHATSDGNWIRVPGPGGIRPPVGGALTPAGRSDSPQPGPSGLRRPANSEEEAGTSGATAAKRPTLTERAWQDPLNQVSVDTIKFSNVQRSNTTALHLAVAHEAYKGNGTVNLAEAAKRLQDRYNSPETRQSVIKEMQTYISDRRNNPLAPVDFRTIPNLNIQKDSLQFENIQELDSKLEHILGHSAPREGEASLLSFALFECDPKTYSKQARSRSPLKTILVQRDPVHQGEAASGKYYGYAPAKGSFQFNNYNEMKEWLNQEVSSTANAQVKVLRIYRNNPAPESQLTHNTSVNTVKLGVNKPSHPTSLLLAIEKESYKESNKVTDLSTAAEKIQSRYDSTTTRNELISELQGYVSRHNVNPLQPFDERSLPQLHANKSVESFGDTQELSEKLKHIFSNSEPQESKASLINISLFNCDEKTYRERAVRLNPVKSLAIQQDPVQPDKYHGYDPKSGSYRFENFGEMESWLNKQINSVESNTVKRLRVYSNQSAATVTDKENLVNTVSGLTVKRSENIAANSTALLLAIENEAYRTGNYSDLPSAAQRIQDRYNNNEERFALRQEMQEYLVKKRNNPIAPKEIRKLPNLTEAEKHQFFKDSEDLDTKLKSIFGSAPPEKGDAALLNLALFESDEKEYASRGVILSPKKVLAIQRDLSHPGEVLTSKYHAYDPDSGSYSFNNYTDMKSWVDKKITDAGSVNAKVLRVYHNTQTAVPFRMNTVSVKTMPELSASGPLLLAIEDAAYRGDSPQELAAVADQFQNQYDSALNKNNIKETVNSYYRSGSEIKSDRPSTSSSPDIVWGDKLPVANPLAPESRRNLSNLSLVPKLVSFSKTEELNDALESAFAGSEDTPAAQLVNLSLFTQMKIASVGINAEKYSYGIQRVESGSQNYLTDRYNVYSPQSGSYAFNNFTEMKNWLNDRVGYQQQHDAPAAAMRIYHKPVYGPDNWDPSAIQYKSVTIKTPFGDANIDLAEGTSRGISGSVGVMSGPHIPDGYVTGYSSRARKGLSITDERTMHPLVHDLYASVPPEARSAYHSNCVEADILSKIAWDNAVNDIDELKALVQDAKMTVYNSKGHYLPPCQSCKYVENLLGYSTEKMEATFV
ncbi:hypothetical protein EHW64_10180 [Erwinia psidii]|uniref:dermonecrotic toxin domain-containing protein n=1 Tax=Erwinia psidii TaxID=69224 RepID=UPI00226B8439|nr:DUF6543 domain-containing protein [Erwinia psidii]MCX8961506.1 hypothetical protein [Erwinia psidii]